MMRLPETEGLPLREGAIITVGTFDGLHRGHQDVLRHLVARASESGKPSLVVTFEPHPLEIVNPAAAPPLLSTHEEKLEMFALTGVNYLAVVPFTHRLAGLEAEDFVQEVLRTRYHLSELLVGHDHGFGRGRLGDINVLRRLGDSLGFGVQVLAPVHTDDGRDISSTAIRRAVAGGDLERAREALGRAYAVSGPVISGDQRGRLLGYPTLNLVPPSRKLLPPDGVYAVRVQTPDGAFGGMANVGARPTFGETERRIEAHVFDASYNWYGAHVRLEFVSWIRDTRAFSGLDALRAQLTHDEEVARSSLAISSVSGSAHLS